MERVSYCTLRQPAAALQSARRGRWHRFAALVLSGGPSLALNPGINAGGVIVACGQVAGQDPDVNVQAQLLKDCNPTGGDGGDGGN